MAGLHERELVASATSPATSEPERLWYAARYSDCIESLRAVAPSSVRFLQTAKAYYRMRRYRDCVACLRAGDAYFTDLESSVLGSALAAESCMACGDREGAAAYLDELKQFESADIPGRLRFEIIHAQALGDWSAGKLREADQRMRAAAPADDGQKARAKIIRSWVYAAQERFVEQTTLLVDALLMLQDAPVADVGLIARACWAISAPLREVFLPEPLAILGDVIRKIPWTDDIALEHFQTLRFSGWAYAFRRNYIRSIRQFQEARDVAPSPYYDVLCQFDGAWVSHIAGESLSSSVQADRAFEAASQLDWNKVEGEECVALLVGAEMVAKSPEKASKLLRAFESARTNISPAMLLRVDRRLDALESFTRAVVAAYQSDTNSVRHFAKAAYQIYESMGFSWRAARAALLLYRSGCGDEWLDSALAHIADYPRSFIAAEIEPLTAARRRDHLRALTARQREVCTHLMRGASIDQVAEALNCSRNTVRIHVGVIYRYFGVHTRAQFMSKAAGLAD